MEEKANSIMTFCRNMSFWLIITDAGTFPSASNDLGSQRNRVKSRLHHNMIWSQKKRVSLLLPPPNGQLRVHITSRRHQSSYAPPAVDGLRLHDPLRRPARRNESAPASRSPSPVRFSCFRVWDRKIETIILPCHWNIMSRGFGVWNSGVNSVFSRNHSNMKSWGELKV